MRRATDLQVHDARRAALRAEIARIDSIAAHRTATVDVFRALGTDPAGV